MRKGEEGIGEWMKIARTDWARVRRNLRDKDVNAAGFFLQQCIEKYLKAFLIKHGWKLRKIHRLDALLDEAIKFMPELDSFQEFCERVSSYYLADRYPPFGSLGISEEDIEKDLRPAEELIKHIFPGEKMSG
ncbi:MAG: HEPN domain-containing protein [Thermodesulfobacteriota bacterium]